MQSLKDCEAYFKPAKKGDMGKYQSLYLAFLRQGFIMCHRLMPVFNVSFVDDEDVEGVLSEAFLKFMNSFDRKKGTMVSFANLSIKNALVYYFVKFVEKAKNAPVSLDYTNEDGQSLLDVVESTDYKDMIDNLNYGDFVYKISSKSSSKLKQEQKISKLILYRLKGYSEEEICKMLRISKGRYWYLLRKAKTLEEYNSMKFDLK